MDNHCGRILTLARTGEISLNNFENPHLLLKRFFVTQSNKVSMAVNDQRMELEPDW